MTTPSDHPRPEESPTSDQPSLDLEAGMAAAFGEGVAAVSAAGQSVLRLLQVRTETKLGVHLPDPEVPGGAPVRIGDDARALRDPGGRYQVLGEIARGGMGVVYKGRDVDLGRDVAMKVLHEKHGNDPAALERFVEEAQIGGQLQHPGIVPVYDLGLYHGDRPYFAMKLVKGETLAAQMVRRSSPCDDLRRFLTIFEQVCQTLAYAHARQVVHRDLKPANVMIGAFGEVQVVDWGFAKVLPEGGIADERRAQRRQTEQSVIETVRSQPSSGTHSVMGSMLGTPAYMPPEQARGDVEHMDQRSDVFGLGAILCEILCGVPPYVEADGPVVEQAARGDVSQALARLEVSGAHPALVALCKQCMAPARRARPRSAKEVAAEVGAYLTSVEERARQAEIHAAEAKVRARSTLLLSAAAVAVLVAIGGGFFWVQAAAARRQSDAEGAVSLALQEASAKRGEAKAGDVDDLASWDQALAAAGQAARLAASEYVGAELRGRVATLLAALRGERAQAAAAASERAKDAAMREAILAARIPPDDDVRAVGWKLTDGRRVDGAYREAFRRYLDERELEELSVGQASDALRRSAIAVELASALDHWAMTRRHVGQGDELTGRLERLARLLDPEDAWRNALRDLLPSAHAKRDELIALKNEAGLQELPVLSLVLLGEALWAAGVKDAAVEVYRRGRDAHPSDFGLVFRLGLLQEMLDEPDWDAAATSYRIAIALRPRLAGAWTGLARALQNQGGLDEAIARYRHALELDAGYDPAHGGLGIALQLQGELDAAVASFRRAIELNPSSAMAHNNFGVTLMLQRKLDEAIVHFRRATRLSPQMAMAHGNLGQALREQGELDAAVTSYRRALDLNPGMVTFLLGLASTLQRQGKLDEAMAQARRAIELDPTSAAPHNSLGYALQRASRLAEAETAFRRAIELDPTEAIYHNNLGNVLTRLGRAAEAVVSLRRAAELVPEYAGVHLNLGVALQEIGKLDEAAAAYRRTLELDPKRLAALNNLGLVHRNQGRLNDAIECFLQCLRADPEDLGAMTNLGGTYDRLGRWDEAIASYRRVLEIDPDFAKALGNLGALYLRRGKAREALACLRRALELEPRNAKFHRNLGWTQQALGESEAALASLRRAVELDPSDGANHNELGRFHAERGEHDEALASFRRAVELAPSEPNSRFNLGVLLSALGQLDEAIEHLGKAAELVPEAVAAHSELGAALGNRGRFLDALASLERAVQLDPECVQAHFNRGSVLQAMGRISAALASYQRAYDLMGERHDAFSVRWRPEVGRRIALLEAELGERPRLLAIARGEAPASSAREWLRAADAACRETEHLAAARAYGAALAAHPDMLVVYPHRYNAACAAILAAGGRGEDAESLAEAERAKLRGQAYGWLVAEFAREKERLAQSESVGSVRQHLEHWLKDPDLDAVRDEAMLGSLPAAEAERWQQLWRDLRSLLAEARQKP